MPKYKLDSEGHYLFFPGYTVICKLNLDEGYDTWYNIFNTLVQNKKVTDYYSILPLSSWHVTAINLFTKDGVESRHLPWDDYVAGKQSFFNELSQILKENPIKPMLTYADLYTNGALQIDVRLDVESIERIEALAKAYHYERNIPSHFHVTLGYQYKALKPTQIAALEFVLVPQIQAFFSAASDMSRQLKPAQLCYFENMLAYTPFEPHSCLNVSSMLISMFSRRAHVTQHVTQADARDDEVPKLT